MKVKDAMVRSVSVCRPEDSLAQAAATMRDERCGALPVVDGRGNVTSLITDRDICIALGARDVRASGLQVKDISLPSVFRCAAGDGVSAALKTMVSQNVRRLPVVDESGKLVGILSIDDLILHSESQPGKAGVSYEDVVNAAKSIVENRSRGSIHKPAELIALEHASGG